MNCPKCFGNNPNNAVFCQNCGARITEVIQINNPNMVTIGRANDNSICINLPGISAHHAKIYFDNGKIQIEDLQSTNGTFVNGRKITRIQLNLKDNVSFGQTQFNLDSEQIQNLFLSTGVTSNKNKTIIESDYSPHSQNMQVYNPTPITPIASQINVNVVTPVQQKSVGVALVLTFFFGSLGMFYSTVTGGIVMCCINFFIFILGLLTLGIAWFAYMITHPICMIWAAIAASEANKILTVNTQQRH